MILTRIAALAATLITLGTFQAGARPNSQNIITCNQQGCSDRAAPVAPRLNKRTYNARIETEGAIKLLPHPQGCPRRAFCACGAAVEVFGKPIRSLWPSVAWFKFPRTSAAPRMVAARRGHVFVLVSHVVGNNWLVNDYNSGGHMSRQHIRSITGYTIVNPHGSMALN